VLNRKLKILQLTTYDIDSPDHGGKLRCSHIRTSLRTRFNVETLSFEWGSKCDSSSFKIQLDQGKMAESGIDGLTVDLGIWTYLKGAQDLMSRLSEMIQSYSPDIIWLEQPFLWPLVEWLYSNSVVDSKTLMINSTHNIEVRMKQKFYEDNYPAEIAMKYTKLVDEMEKRATNAAVASIAVSRADADYFESLNGGDHVAIFPNGHTVPAYNNKNAKWKSFFSDSEVNWVFVGSWHPPNVNGLRDLAHAMLKNIKSGKFAVWVLGGAGNGLEAIQSFEVNSFPWLRIMGPVTADDIDAAILESSGVVLPLWEGGGSNLKTAQALLSGKCIVASKFAFRGFEDCVCEPGVFLASEPMDLGELLLMTKPEKYYARGKIVHDFEWSSILSGLPDFVERVIKTHLKREVR